MTTTHARRLLLGLLAAGALLAASVYADRAVPGYTLVPVTAGDCISMTVTRQSDGAGGTVIVTTTTFEVKDSTGAVRYTASVSHQLTTAQRTSLGQFINNVHVPLANAQENL